MTAPEKWHYKLRSEVRAELIASSQGFPSNKSLRNYIRAPESPHRGQVERSYDQLELGKPVAENIARAFVAYLGEVRGLKRHFDEVFEPAMPIAKRGAWESPQALFNAIASPFGDCPSSYMQNPRNDFLLASRMIMHSAGYKAVTPGERLDEAACLDRACRIMSRTVEGFARWIRDITRGDKLYRSVMFYHSGRRRIGVTVLLPLTESAYHRVCNGELNDYEITCDDLQVPSRFLFMTAMSDGQGAPPVKNSHKTLSQTRNFLYQMAYFSRGIVPFRPVIVAFASNERYADLLKRQGFVKTGTNLKGTNFPIVALSHPKEVNSRSKKHYVNYATYTLLMFLYRKFNKRQWRMDDDLLNKNDQS